MFYTGLKVNAIRCFEEHHIGANVKTSQSNIVHFKQNESYIPIISKEAIKLHEIPFTIIFIRYQTLQNISGSNIYCFF